MEKAEKIVLGIVIVLMGIILAIGVNSFFQYNKAMDECLADGRKHYECKAMLQPSGGRYPIFR